MVPRRAIRTAAALAGFAFGLCGAELASRPFRHPPASAPAPLVFSFELRDATGELLASPLVVGETGKRLHLTLQQPPGGPRLPGQHRGQGDQPGLQMSLDLDPQQGAEEQAICLGYRLSLDPGDSHEGKLGVTLGQRSSVELHGHSRYTLDLTVARAGSPALEKLLRARSRPVI